MTSILRGLQRWARYAALSCLFAISACSGSNGTSGSGAQLAADQVLNIPVIGDPVSLDPASGHPIALPISDSVISNLFDGLYRFDQTGHIEPDIATSLPEVSSDQRTYTFHLRSDAAFWNGDPVTADDFVYSWSRAVSISGAIPFSGLSVIVGADDVAARNARTLRGLTAHDSHTLVATLVRPAGYWPATLANDETFVVDQKVIAAKGEVDWWKTPDGLVGTGPFKMQNRVIGRSLDFVPVEHWWRGSTGRLKKVHLQVVGRVEDTDAAFANGDFGLAGLGTTLYDPAAYARWRRFSNDWYVYPAGNVLSLVFDVRVGPFQGSAGRDGRIAFSQAIDRVALARQVCGDIRFCTPATGGLIPKELAGYLGDGADSNARFNATAARSQYQQWDPGASKVLKLAYVYPGSSGFVSDEAELRQAHALQQMWRSSIGVEVALDEVANGREMYREMGQGTVALSRFGWGADYNSPEDWYEIPGLCDTPLYQSAVCTDLVNRADGQPFASSDSAYAPVGRLLTHDVAMAPLLYYNNVTVVQPWVLGAKGFIRIDAPWTGISILSH